MSSDHPTGVHDTREWAAAGGYSRDGRRTGDDDQYGHGGAGAYGFSAQAGNGDDAQSGGPEQVGYGDYGQPAHHGYEQPGYDDYGQPGGHPQPGGYGRYPQPAHGGYAHPGYGGYGQPGAYPQPAYGYYGGYPLPDHPNAATVLVLGIVGLFFPLTAFVGLYLGQRARSEIRAGAPYSSEGTLKAGWVISLIITVLSVVGLVLGFIALVAVGIGFTISIPGPDPGMWDAGTLSRV